MPSPAKPMPSATDFHAGLLHPRHWLTWLGLLLLLPVSWLPWQLRRRIGRTLGQLIYNKNAKRRHTIQTNLRLCFPQLNENERDQLGLRTLQAYACALLDYSVLFFRSRRWLRQRTYINGQHKIEQTLQNEQNIVLLLGHSHWLEFAPLAIGEHYSSYGSYKPFENPIFNWMVASSRLKDVDFVIAREEGMVKLVRSLKLGQLLFFLPDEDHGIKHSNFAPFFSVDKATLNTPSRIAKMSKAKCFPVLAFFDETQGKYCVEIGDALPDFGQHDAIADATQMNVGFEQLIALHPEQYMWQLKLFRTVPAGKEPVY